jgi:hypothetical protein
MPIVRVKRVYIKIPSIEECRYQTVLRSVKELVVAFVYGLASQGVIPIPCGLAESYWWSSFSILNWVAKNFNRGTYSILYRPVELMGSSLFTAQPAWY